MCKVPGKVRGRAVLFAVAELLVNFNRILKISSPGSFLGIF